MYTNVRTQAADLLEEAGDYIRTMYQLVTLKVSRKVTTIIAGLIADFSVMITGLISLFFLSIAGAFWIGNYVQNTSEGFLWVGCFYFTLFVLLLLLKKRKILPYLRNLLTTRMNEKRDESI